MLVQTREQAGPGQEENAREGAGTSQVSGLPLYIFLP